jgi:hypothetical protein
VFIREDPWPEWLWLLAFALAATTWRGLGLRWTLLLLLRLLRGTLLLPLGS